MMIESATEMIPDLPPADDSYQSQQPLQHRRRSGAVAEGVGGSDDGAVSSMLSVTGGSGGVDSGLEGPGRLEGSGGLEASPFASTGLSFHMSPVSAAESRASEREEEIRGQRVVERRVAEGIGESE